MVHIVGAGPGAEDLITVRGLKFLKEADIVIYAGSLVNPGLLKETKPGAVVYDSIIPHMLSMLPGVGSQLKNVEVDDSQFSRIEAIILSMTPQERANPDLINPSRKKRIAQGGSQ